MQWKRLFVIPVYLWIACWAQDPAWADEPSGNLVKNESFEEDSDSDDAPDGWPDESVLSR